jgi:8-oxo-dGTP pyrophosphatase MutT (NUDIX family)/phosphohistidine phosphatase SixA
VAQDSNPSVLAAGAVLWRNGERGIEVAVIHRPKYDDWSLPKGKLDPGETTAGAAVRELKEETGFDSHLGRHLMRVSYPVAKKQRKQVDYWAARCNDGEFTPGAEVDELRWLPLKPASKLLSYTLDRKVLARFGQISPDTGTVLLVRHALAGRRERFHGNDDDRPLDERGTAQARALVPQLLAFGAMSAISAHPLRCIATVKPLAQELGVDVEVDRVFSEEEFKRDPQQTNKRMREILRSPGTPVVCSQGGVIPDLMSSLAERYGVTLPPASNRKGSTWVISVREDGRMVAADHLPPPVI